MTPRWMSIELPARDVIAVRRKYEIYYHDAAVSG